MNYFSRSVGSGSSRNGSPSISSRRVSFAAAGLVVSAGIVSSAGVSMLFHAGGDRGVGSAGCQTMPPDEYERFWSDVNADGDPGVIGYTLIDYA